MSLGKSHLLFVEKAHAHFFFVQGFAQRLDSDHLIYVTAITNDTTAITKPAIPIPLIAVFVSVINQS